MYLDTVLIMCYLYIYIYNRWIAETCVFVFLLIHSDSQQLFYQIIMYDFGNFGVLRLSVSLMSYKVKWEANLYYIWTLDPYRVINLFFFTQESVSINYLALIALDDPSSGWKEGNGSKKDLADYITKFLTNKSDMLNDYFSIEIDQVYLLNEITCSLWMILMVYIILLWNIF